MKHLTWMTAILFLGAAVAAAQDNDALQKQVDSISIKVEKALGVKFTKPVPAAYQTREEFGKFVNEMARKEFTEKKNRETVLYYHLLGLVPKDFNFLEAAIGLMVSQAAAYYDPETKKMFVVTGGLSGMLLETTLFHELVHAAQDQEHNLEKLMKDLEKEGDSDKIMAFRLLVEGEASYWMNRYMMEKMGMAGTPQEKMAVAMFKTTTTKKIMMLMNLQGLQSPELKKQADALSKAPPILVRPLVDPYLRGMYASYRIAEEKGAAGFRTIFRQKPPRCSRDLMYCDDWLAKPRGIKRVKPAPLGGALGAGWKLDYADTAGSMTLNVMFEDQSATAERISRAWDGDRLEVWKNGDRAFVSGILAFRDEASAKSCAKQIERKYREDWTGGKDIKEHGAAFVHLSADKDHLGVEVKGDRVHFFRGDVPIAGGTLMAELRKGEVREPAKVF